MRGALYSFPDAGGYEADYCDLGAAGCDLGEPPMPPVYGLDAEGEGPSDISAEGGSPSDVSAEGGNPSGSSRTTNLTLES